MEVYNLADKPEYLQKVVDVLYQEWGNHSESNSNRNYWESWVKSSLSTTDVPQTLIGLEDETLIATASLWRCDLQSRQDLFPWFGGLWVKPEYRMQGIGTMMQTTAIEKLRLMGYRTVYLFTDLIGFYEKSGWFPIGSVPDEKGIIVNLYQYNIRE